MKTIDSIFVSEVTIPLYHYTGIGSLLGIAKNESLWASSISYMNDSKEIVLACETVEKVLRAELVFGVDNEELQFLKQFVEWTKTCSQVANTIFVFSLSEKPSLLSQWRSYTPHGKGVSLEFSPSKVNEIARNSDMKIAKCVYEPAEQKEVIGILIDKLLANFRLELPTMDITNKPPNECYFDFIRQYTGEILQVLAIIKHSAFREECEWRLISSNIPHFKDSRLKFREGASMLIPYIELGLGSRPFFESIIIGPSEHQNLNMSGLSMFKSNKGLTSRLTNCQIPYREW